MDNAIRLGWFGISLWFVLKLLQILAVLGGGFIVLWVLWQVRKANRFKSIFGFWPDPDSIERNPHLKPLQQGQVDKVMAGLAMELFRANRKEADILYKGKRGLLPYEEAMSQAFHGTCIH